MAADWLPHLEREVYSEELVTRQDGMADAARVGDWDRALVLIDDTSGTFPPSVNQWRIGGRSWFAVMHQAAWHGASDSVVAQLLRRGAWRSLRDREGRRPVDIAAARGHDHLLSALEPRFRPEYPGREAAAALGDHFAAVVQRVVMAEIRRAPALRVLDVDVLFETEGPDEVWMPIGGMLGGFAIELRGADVHVRSWSRMVTGSGMHHVVTPAGATLVDEGFVCERGPMRVHPSITRSAATPRPAAAGRGPAPSSRTRRRRRSSSDAPTRRR